MFMTSKSCSMRWSCRRSSPPLTRKGYSCSSLPRIVIRFGFLNDSITLILDKDRKKKNICDRRLGLTESSLEFRTSVIPRWHNQVTQLEKQMPTCSPSSVCCKMCNDPATIKFFKWYMDTDLYHTGLWLNLKNIPVHQTQRFLRGTLAMVSLFRRTDLKW